MAALHVEAERSLNFLADENDDFNSSCEDTKQEGGIARERN